ncbi:hypothetical protein D3C81_1071780 [compost metagenome]
MVFPSVSLAPEARSLVIAAPVLLTEVKLVLIVASVFVKLSAYWLFTTKMRYSVIAVSSGALLKVTLRSRASP